MDLIDEINDCDCDNNQDTIYNNKRIDYLMEEFEPKDDDELQVQSTKSESVIESSMKEESSKRSRWISVDFINYWKTYFKDKITMFYYRFRHLYTKYEFRIKIKV